MKIRNKKELDAAILDLEKKKQVQEEQIISGFKAARESLSPMNLIKHGLNRITKMPDVQNGLLSSIASIGVTVLSKKFMNGKSSSLIKNLLGSVVQLAVAKSAYSHTEKIKAYGISIYNNLFKKKSVSPPINNTPINN